MNRTLALVISVVAMVLAAMAPARAHPHVWVDARAEIVFDAAGRAIALRHHWTFDEAFSAFASQGLDTDGDGKLTRAELQPLADVNVESLVEFDFFTFLTTGDISRQFAPPAEHWLEAGAGRLTLHFTLPLAEPLAVDTAGFSVEIYDPEYFVAFSLPDTEAIRLAEAPSGCQVEVQLARALSAADQATLAAIGPEQRQLPDELQALTEDLGNIANISCR